jgi:hypothetical protein
MSHVGQVKGDDPDKEGYPGPTIGGLGVGLTPTLLTIAENETVKETKAHHGLQRPKMKKSVS